MKNIVIDTNVLYQIYGREKLGIKDNYHGKVNDSRLHTIIFNNDIYVTSVTLVEIMTHFKSNPILVQELFRYILNNHFSVLSVGISDISLDELKELCTTSIENLKFKIKNVTKEKISFESHYATLMLILELEQYYCYYFESLRYNDNNYSHYSPELQNLICDSFIEKYINLDLYKRTDAAFKKTLKTGYSNDNINMAEKLLKQKFNKILETECINFVFVLSLIIDSNFKFDFDDLLNNWDRFKKLDDPYFNLINEKMEIHKDFLNLSKFKATINTRIRRSIVQFDKTHHSDFYDQFKEYVVKELFAPLGLKIPVDYIGKIMDRWTIAASDYEKNNILDMFILRAVNIENYIILTFDEMMQDYLHEIRHISSDYINRVYTRK